MSAGLDDPLALAAELRPATDWLVALDFDGVLSPIVDRPEDAVAAPGIVPALRALAERTAVAVLSGRPVAELDQRLGVLPIVYAGGHGAEVRDTAGRHHTFVEVDAVTGVLDAVEAELRALLPAGDGWQVERKPASLAVHHRRVDVPARDALLPRVHGLLDRHRDDGPGFEVLDGKAVIELRPTGVDKGRALAWIVSRTPGLRPLVLGDDVTDEDAFREADRHDGMGVLVSEVARASLARRRLHGPDEVAVFLRAFGADPGSGAPD